MPGTGTRQPPRFELIAVVASLGGLAATSELLAGLPAHFPVPVLLVQHGRPDQVPGRLAGLLERRTALPVRTARPGMTARMPGVTVIPAGHDATLGSDGRLCLAGRQPCLSPGDALLASVAEAAGAAAIAVIMTGRLHDGTQGARAVKRRGGRVLAQDPGTARAGDMPRSAIATGCVDFILPPGRIAPALTALTMAPGGAELLAVAIPPWAQLT
jgi:two-component system chemotaxis response regulator CheB